MGKKLVISEKPSVARSISKVLGVTKRCDGYLESEDYIISWCVGHLVELAAPESYDARYAKWRREDLPILPERWQYQVTAATKKQFRILKQLMKRADVERLVCATDAGREGELIFRLVYHECHCKKPFERLWISSMEDSAIREGFAHLKPSSAYDALYEAALCRERADWIVGMNATRLFSCLYGQTLNVGRVMTPTLAMAVAREAAIAAFVPEPFWTVQIGFADCTAASERFRDKQRAIALKVDCEKELNAAVKLVERKEKSEKPPALYDLTSLQRDANRILGFTAQQTLDYTQSLYEKKLVTYPRTDSRYLTADMGASLSELVSDTAKMFGIEEGIPVCPAQVINGKKVSDHHAIIPTRELRKCKLDELPKGELSVLQLISVRLLAAVGEPYRYAETTVQAKCGGEVFTAKGRTVLHKGWKAVEKRFFDSDKGKKEAKPLPELVKGQEWPVTSVELKEGKTTPPRHFTEDLLLQAMESASAEEFPEEAERKGIGTPATRAAIIEKLVQKGFLERRGNQKTKVLIPTDKGSALITVVPEQIQSPSMTAEWEDKLVRMEHGDYEPEDFMREITGMVTDLVQNYEIVKGAKVLMPDKKVVGCCPHCGSEVLERQKGWFCANRECRFVLWKDNAYFYRLDKRLTGQMVEKLLRDGRVRLKDCKSQRTGKAYNAVVLLDTEADGRAKFSMEFENRGG